MKDKTKFILKLVLFLIFALAIPIAYLGIRYDLFTKASKLSITFWGFIAILLLVGVVSVLIKLYISGLKTKYKWFKQVLEGVIKLIIPLLILLLVITWLYDNIEAVKQFLFVLIPSEAVAICVNPLPKWCFDNNIDGLGEIFDKINKHKEE